jgi:hypothetical protein
MDIGGAEAVGLVADEAAGATHRSAPSHQTRLALARTRVGVRIRHWARTGQDWVRRLEQQSTKTKAPVSNCGRGTK